MTRKILLSCLAILAALQFIRPERPILASPPQNSMEQMFAVPGDVQIILKRACYDCHSNTTRYPWYSEIMPLGWWIQGHINEGRDALNIHDFGEYQEEDIPYVFEEIAKEVRNGNMPLKSYLWGHPEARLTKAEIEAIGNWATEMSQRR